MTVRIEVTDLARKGNSTAAVTREEQLLSQDWGRALGKSSNCAPGRAPACSGERMIQVTECPIPGTHDKPAFWGPQSNLQQGTIPQGMLQSGWNQCCRELPMAVHQKPPYTAAPKARGRTLKDTVRCRSPMLQNAQMLWELSNGGCKEGWGWQVLGQMKGTWGLAYGASTVENSMARRSPGWDQSHKLPRDCSFWFCGTGTRNHCIFHNQFTLGCWTVWIAEKSQESCTLKTEKKNK